MQDHTNIIIVDDDPGICETLKDILEEDGYKVTTALNIRDAQKALADKFYSIALVDLVLPGGYGMELLKDIRRLNYETVVIVFTGFATIESAILAMNEGAFTYLKKPLNIDELKVTIKKAITMQRLLLDNKNLLDRLKELSLKDPLTGLYNYRYLRERLPSEFKRAKRYALPLSVIMLDLDYFKSINDVYGHQYGDNILKEIAQFLINFARGNDVVIRCGGEEFIIILPDINKDGAFMFAIRLLNAFDDNVFDAAVNRIRLKISIGIAAYPDAGITTEPDILDAADRALRESKEAGGNRLSVFKGTGSHNAQKPAEKCAAEDVDKLRGKLFRMEKRVNQTLLESIYAFAKTIEARDYYTGEHAESMVSIVTRIGEKLDLSCKDIENLEHAAILHDLGKVGIPDYILHKKTTLTKEEYDIIKSHPKIGAEIIRSVHFLNDVVPIVLYHHERFDGRGYCAGLKGQDIPLGARIVAVADVYQALTSDRPYRKAYSKEVALKIIKEASGTQFDPEIVKLLVSIEVIEICQR